MDKVNLTPLKNYTDAFIEIPGSKSYTNRALLLAALTKDKVLLKNVLFSEDTEAMLGCLEGFVINIEKANHDILVTSDISQVKDTIYKLNARLSGLTIRTILALSCIIPGIKILDCDEGLKKRPIGELVNALRKLGAEIEYLEKEGYPLLKITSSKLNSGEVTLKGNISSQFLSALLIIAPKIGKLTINIEGELISKPYIDMTIDIMEKFNVNVINENYKRFTVKDHQDYQKDEYIIEGDYSSAAYFFAVAALTRSKITVGNLNSNSKQADKSFLNLLEKMGNEVIYGENNVTVLGKGVKPVKADLTEFPDQVQTLASLAAFANGVTEISGIKSLRLKETDRVLALENELQKMGIKTEVSENEIKIHGGNPRPSEIETYGDHRMAMAFAVAGTKLKGMIIKDPEVVRKTFPEFWEKLKSIGVKMNE